MNKIVNELIQNGALVYNDSDIEIIHKPHDNHGGRDLQIFAEMVEKGEVLSARLREIYTKELYIVGKESDFACAELFLKACTEEAVDMDELKRVSCVLARYYRITGNTKEFFKYALKVTALEGCSEMCYEIGEFYYENKEWTKKEMMKKMKLNQEMIGTLIQMRDGLLPKLMNREIFING